ncbi:integrase core domain-containing protein [Corynebacterium diphtheriae]|nr:integrase core domain-containing protein [Corynebacterium diphtheriae]
MRARSSLSAGQRERLKGLTPMHYRNQALEPLTT